VRQCATRDSGKNILGLFSSFVHHLFRKAHSVKLGCGPLVKAPRASQVRGRAEPEDGSRRRHCCTALAHLSGESRFAIRRRVLAPCFVCLDPARPLCRSIQSRVSRQAINPANAKASDRSVTNRTIREVGAGP
jgi:hypothetical protein